ncbi:MAG: GNAT family protein [Eubacteriales bacterium]|nr:GNAT family protein [Eubacteriales bacterium]
MKTEYIISTLKLKVCTEVNVFEVLEFYQDNREYFDLYEPDKPSDFYTKEYIVKLLRAEYNAFLNGSFVRFFLYDTAISNRIIGTVSFSHILNGSVKSCTIGYKIDHEHWRLGYCRQMLNAAVRIICTEKGMHRIEAYIHPDNIPSIKTAQALNFTSEGLAYSYIKLHGSWQDMLRFVYIS